MQDEAYPHLVWPKLEQESSIDYGIFRLRRHRAAHPDTGHERTFSVLDTADWVNVIALTPADGVVMVRQFRHGTEEVTLEIPGGIVDPGETPRQAAERELREETGHSARQWVELGVVAPNPAIQSNRCTTFLALDAQHAHDQALDPGETIDVETHPLGDISRLIGRGAITHSLVVAAFAHLVVRAGGWWRP